MLYAKRLFEYFNQRQLSLLADGVETLWCPQCRISALLKYYGSIHVQITKPKKLNFVRLNCPICGNWVATINLDSPTGEPALELRSTKT